MQWLDQVTFQPIDSILALLLQRRLRGTGLMQ